MPQTFSAWPAQQSAGLRATAIAIVVGLHLAVGALIFWSPVIRPEPAEPEMMMVRFVEIGPEPQQAQAPPAPQPPVEAPPPEPEVEPEPEPEPEPEIEPEPEPPVVEKPPMPAPKPKPKPKPKPRPKPPEKKPVEPPKPVEIPPPAPPSGTPEGTGKPQGPQGPPPDQPRLIGRVDYLGRRPVPVYPRASLMRREEGRVIVRVSITTQGDVASVSLQRSSGYERLDQSALDAARKARFKPYTENGVAYPAMADIPFDFVLRN